MTIPSCLLRKTAMRGCRILMVSGSGPPLIDGVGHYTARLLNGLAPAPGLGMVLVMPTSALV